MGFWYVHLLKSTLCAKRYVYFEYLIYWLWWAVGSMVTYSYPISVEDIQIAVLRLYLAIVMLVDTFLGYGMPLIIVLARV